MDDIHDIMPPVLIEWKWTDFMAWYIAAAILIALGAITYFLWKKSNQPTPIDVPAIDPLEQALEEVRAAYQAIGESNDKALAQRLSDIVRYYLENNFQLPAPEKTTEEFLRELQHVSWINQDSSQMLSKFLHMCDEAKFAQHEFNRTDRHHLQNSAYQFLKSTEVPKITNPETEDTP